MRNFIISLICLGALLGIWAAFDSYSSHTINRCRAVIEQDIIKTVEAEKWDEAYHKFRRFSGDWHRYRRTAVFFLDTRAINETDYSIAKAEYYIKSRDISNSSGELSSLSEQLACLKYNETPTLGNIF